MCATVNFAVCFYSYGGYILFDNNLDKSTSTGSKYVYSNSIHVYSNSIHVCVLPD